MIPDASPRSNPATIGPVRLAAAGAAFVAAAGVAEAAPDSFANLAQQVSPSVVNITTSTTVAQPARDELPQVPEGSPFEDFFRDFMERQGPGERPRRPRRSQALGSGFVISEDGFVVTNNHVIDGADEILVEFFGGEELRAEVVGTDPNTDIALLKVDGDEPLPAVPFGDSEAIEVGDWVMAMGNPLGQGFSVSAGIVSARGRALQGSYDDYIQTDAAINRGNSGGPLFNMEGEVVGVNTAILSPTGGSIGIGFAMASNVVTNVVAQLQEYGETRRGWLGVRIEDVTEDVAEALGLEEARGALINDVPDGPAAEAGFEVGDVILSFDGTEVGDTRELVNQVGNTEVGKEVEVVLYRDGDRITETVTLGRREEADGVAADEPQEELEDAPAQEQVLGLTVGRLTDDLRQSLDLGDEADGLVIVEVDEESEAFDKGLQPGDIIAEAGQQEVGTPEELNAAIEQARENGRRSILFLIRRAGEPRFVALPLDEADGQD